MPKADANAGNDEGLYGRAIKNNALRVKDSLVETVSQLVVHPQGACEPEKGEKKNSTWRFVGNTAERVKDGAVGISSSALAAVMSVASTAATRLTGDDAVTVAPKKKEKTRLSELLKSQRNKPHAAAAEVDPAPETPQAARMREALENATGAAKAKAAAGASMFRASLEAIGAAAGKVSTIARVELTTPTDEGDDGIERIAAVADTEDAAATTEREVDRDRENSRDSLDEELEAAMASLNRP